jgi:hypothetical protein
MVEHDIPVADNTTCHVAAQDEYVRLSSGMKIAFVNKHDTEPRGIRELFDSGADIKDFSGPCPRRTLAFDQLASIHSSLPLLICRFEGGEERDVYEHEPHHPYVRSRTTR